MYNPKSHLVTTSVLCGQSHRDVPVDLELMHPAATVKDCEFAIEYIMRKEKVPAALCQTAKHRTYSVPAGEPD